MLFENPAVAAKLPFPYNVPPPLQAAAAAAAAVPNLSNPIDNAAAAAAAAAAGLIDHSSLIASLNSNVAAVNGTLTTAVLKSASVAQQQHHHQQQQTNAAIVNNQTSNQQNVNASVNSNTVAAAQQHSAAQQATLALLNGTSASNTQTNSNASNVNGQTNQQQQQQTVVGGQNAVVKATNSGRSTPNNSVNGSVASDPAPGKLFVGGLSWQTSAEKLKEYFNMFGTVTDVLIMKDPVTQRSRGFGFITFQEPCSVDKVLQVPIHTLDGKKIDPKHATPKNRPRQSNKTKKIFVGGVSQDTSAEEVKAYFNQFGNVEETVMLMDQQTKRHRGFGFVTFENEDVVDRVCEIHFHTIKNKKVECKKAQPKEAVTPAAQLLQKRIMLGTLGVQLPTPPGQLLGARTAAGVTAAMNPLAMLQTPTQLQLHASGAAAAAAQQAALITQNPFQVQNAAAAAAVAANPGGFGKLLTTYPQAALHSVRYSPYPIPASAAAAANALAAQHHHHHQQQQQAAAAVQQQHQQNAAAAAVAQQHSAATNTAAVAAAATQAHNAAALAAAGNTSAAAGAAGAVTNPLAAAAAQQAALVASTNHHLSAAAAAANPYQSYTLANVDMTGFQGVDWSSMYGMGMYV
ncbi:poly(U)-binding-splicing factor PUF60-B isoform X2 [Glossina fuscipes]|uniref:Poly(U)-binding-splicing factor PUF60-B isoform X2 n=1 Tax=Glossina fuscipes TaxID=7396 RepID=A0A9C5Z155_9MUSC|nr:poly(U)-binding-splicing factor PUF60-B isoform X2 [Glossina fuscipes]